MFFRGSLFSNIFLKDYFIKVIPKKKTPRGGEDTTYFMWGALTIGMFAGGESLLVTVRLPGLSFHHESEGQIDFFSGFTSFNCYQLGVLSIS